MKTEKANPFITKLYQILEDENNSEIIHWKNNNSFMIINKIAFEKEILPKYFKTNTFKSFIRQLNKYDFKKIRSELSFKNKNFTQNKEKSIHEIIPKDPFGTFKELKENKLEVSLFNYKAISSFKKITAILEAFEEKLFIRPPEEIKILIFENFDCVIFSEILEKHKFLTKQVFFYNDFENIIEIEYFNYLIIDQEFYEIYRRTSNKLNKTKIIVTWENEQYENHTHIFKSLKKPYGIAKLLEILKQ